jgi:ribosome biogenesis GTPase / thiamine phosphate phosphatase
MSKRRITTNQERRIQAKQKRHLELNSEHILSKGLIITRFGQYAELETERGERIQCAIRPTLGDVVAGDRVVYQLEAQTQAVIVSVYPRQTTLARVNKQHQSKPIAANITQICIVITEIPMLSWMLLDSYLVMAQYLGCQPLIIVNKMDIVSAQLARTIREIYEPLGYTILSLQQQDPKNNALLEKQLKEHVSIFVGQSGVGKSSIIRRLLPHEQDIQIGELSTHRVQGQHTTSYAKYYHLPQGGAIIDSPGVREFNLTELDLREIADNYVEFKPFISHCKYRNCTHIETPQCAIIQALENGLIMKQRYENYVRIAKAIGL